VPAFLRLRPLTDEIRTVDRLARSRREPARAVERAQMIWRAHQGADLGLTFGGWTLDRLTAHLQEHKRLGIGRTRIGEILRAEGLRWRTQEAWFGERVDPEFVAKRGPSSRSTRRQLPLVS
jgi:transposase